MKNLIGTDFEGFQKILASFFFIFFCVVPVEMV